MLCCITLKFVFYDRTFVKIIRISNGWYIKLKPNMSYSYEKIELCNKANKILFLNSTFNKYFRRSYTINSYTKREEKIEVIHGTENVINLVLDCLNKVEEKLDIYIDAPSVFIVTSNDILLDAYHKAKDRGVNIRAITEITSFSLYYIQKMFPVVNEIRHIDGLIGTFGISDKDYIGTDVSPIDTDTLSQRAIHCNLKVFLQQQQYFFDTLWNKAIPVEQKMMEIEKGTVSSKIETITNPSEIETKYIQILEKATDEILDLLHN